MRERLHEHRYLMFQHGVTVREIAETEGVDERQIYLSISRCETRLPKADVMANRNFRNAMVAQRKLAEKYTQTLSDLMDGKAGKNWSQRSKALQHFQRTVGMDTGGGVLPTDAAHDPALRKRFQQEARAAAAISHPAIATVFDVGEDNDQSYIVFEFVPGTTLRTFVKPGGVGLEPLYGRPGVRWHCRTNAQARVGRNWFHHGI